MNAWPFRAREIELGRIADILASGGSAVVVGGPGLGKTRLARAAYDGGYASGRALWMSCGEALSEVPYGVFAAHLAEARPVTKRNDELARLAHLSRLLGADGTGRGSTVFVDDAQWLDHGSGALLHQLAVAGRAQLLMTVRAGEDPPREIAKLWRDGYAERLDLEPFGRPEVRSLVSGRLGGRVDEVTAERIRLWTNGNALHIRELVEAGMAQGQLRRHRSTWTWFGEPVTDQRLDDIIRAHLAKTPPDLRRGLFALAVADPATPDVADAVAGATALSSLVAAGLAVLEDADGVATYRLAHPLYRGHALMLASAGELAHARAAHARALQSAVLPGQADVRLLLAKLEAGMSARDGELVLAANQAMHADQTALADRLISHIADHERRTAAHGHLLVHQQRWFDAERILAGVDLAALSTDEAEDTVCYRANVLRFLSRLDDALVLLGGIAGPSVRILVRHGLLLRFAGDDAQAVRLFKTIESRTRERLTSDHLRMWEMVSFAVPALIEVGELQQAIEVHRRVDHVGQQRPWTHEWWTVLLCQPQLLVAQGLIEAALKRATRLWFDAVAATNRYAAHVAGVERTRVAITMGRYGEARAALAEAVAVVNEQMPVYWRRGLWALEAIAAAASGDTQTADDRLAALAATPDGGPFTVRTQFTEWTVVERYAAAFLEACHGSLSSAIEGLTALDDLCAERGLIRSRLDILLLLARLGSTKLAMSRRRSIHVGESSLWRATAAYIEALDHGDGPDLAAVAERFEALGLLPLAAEAFDVAAGRLAYGRAAVMAAHRREDCIARCDAVALAWWPTRAIAGLTRREQEIAKLAARGLASRQIADQLFLSVRTVDNHLQRAFAKLGVSNRAELASRITADS